MSRDTKRHRLEPNLSLLRDAVRQGFHYSCKYPLKRRRMLVDVNNLLVEVQYECDQLPHSAKGCITCSGELPHWKKSPRSARQQKAKMLFRIC
jgi:hypothetical protein